MCLQSSCKLPISSWKAGTFSFLNIIYSTCFLLREPFRLLFSFSFKWQPLWTSSHQRNINPFVPGNFTAKKPFEAYCRAIFWSLIGYIKRPNWSKLPSIVRTLRGLLFQTQNFRFRSWAHEQKRQICFRFFEFHFPLSLRLRPLLSLFLPHFLFAGTLILMGKGFGEALRIIGLNRKEV